MEGPVDRRPDSNNEDDPIFCVTAVVSPTALVGLLDVLLKLRSEEVEKDERVAPLLIAFVTGLPEEKLLLKELLLWSDMVENEELVICVLVLKLDIELLDVTCEVKVVLVMPVPPACPKLELHPLSRLLLPKPSISFFFLFLIK